MNIHQRDIIEIAFYTGNKPEAHPAIVVSVDDIFESEGFVYAILLSTKNIFPDFTLEITPDLINKPPQSASGICCLPHDTTILSRRCNYPNRIFS